MGASGTNVGVEADADTFVFTFRLRLGCCEDDVFSSAECFGGLATETEELEGAKKLEKYNTFLSVSLLRRMQVFLDLLEKLKQVSGCKQARGYIKVGRLETPP